MLERGGGGYSVRGGGVSMSGRDDVEMRGGGVREGGGMLRVG